MMKFDNVFIPYRAYWSTPFCRWQGALSNEHPLKLVAVTAQNLLHKIDCDVQNLQSIHFGMTVPQYQSFFGAPWIAAMIGAPHITGPTISQACATSARVIASTASMIALGSSDLSLALAADRISNGPHIYYPNPHGIGGHGQAEDWVLDNFNHDPYAHVAMVETAENIAKKYNISRQAQEDAVLCRYQQYQMALADERKFQKRYMQEVPIKIKKETQIIAEDAGITAVNMAAMQKLKPIVENGTVTYAMQTHPADGNAGMVLARKETAQDLSHDKAVTIQLLCFAEGRAEKAHMGMAPVPAAQKALTLAGLKIGDIKVIKTHNPFIVNDIYFAQQTNLPIDKMNNYGSSLIYGHPQAPTGLRLIIEMIEELVLLGGGYGLFTGCAAGDTGAAIIIKI